MDIYDEINLDIDPFKVLRISKNSDNETVKQAYKLIRSSFPPDKIHIVDAAYKLIKTEQLRERYKLLEPTPYENLDDIKPLHSKPKRITTSYWLGLISQNNSKT